MGHSLNLLLHTRPDDVVQGVKVWRWWQLKLTKTSIFTENPNQSKLLEISLFKTIFKTAYLSQFSTYRYETPLFWILTGRRFQRWVKRRHTPIQSRDIEQNVKVILPFLIPRSLILTIFTFCSISLDWMGVGRCSTHRWRRLLVRISKSGASYLYVENWLKYTV